MLSVYLKFLKKNVTWGIIPPLILSFFVPLLGSFWTAMLPEIENFSKLLENPIYDVFLGSTSSFNFTDWTGFYYIELFTFLELVIIFTVILVPTRLITSELDNNTFDLILSYPISRWRYIFEKFCVFLTYNLLYPVFILILTYQTIISLNVEMNLVLLLYSLFGVWMIMFSLGSLSLLCGVIFFESNRSLAASGIIVLSQYILVRIGSISNSLSYLKNYSIFNYLTAHTIVTSQKIPLYDLFIVSSIGISALIFSLILIEEKEF